MNKTKNLVLMLLVLLYSQAGYADDKQWVFAPSMNIELKSNALNSINSGVSQRIASTTYKTLSPSLAVGYGNFFGSLTYDFTVMPGESIRADYTSMLNYVRRSDVLSRDEVSISGGYRVYESKYGYINLLIGYHNTSSHIDEKRAYFDSLSTPQSWRTTSDIDFTENGPYIGANYTYPIGNHALTFSLAYAKLDGRLNALTLDSSDGNVDNFVWHANSAGLSYGVVLSGPMTKNMNYNIGYKIVNYRFDVTSADDLVAGTSTPVAPGTLAIENDLGVFYFGTTIFI